MKAGERIYQYYKGLPNWAQGAMIIGGLAIAWFGVARPIEKLIKKKLDQSKMAKEGKEAKDTLQELARKGIKPTITSGQAESFCNALRIAFSGCGTDEFAIYAVMSQLKNDADVYLLISTYGIRKYYGCGPWGVISGSRDVSLSAAISDELDATEKTIVSNILAKNNIKFRFA